MNISCSATCVVVKRLTCDSFITSSMYTGIILLERKVVITSNELLDTCAPVFKGLLALNERWPLIHILSRGHSWAVNLCPFHSVVSFRGISEVRFQMIYPKGSEPSLVSVQMQNRLSRPLSDLCSL